MTGIRAIASVATQRTMNHFFAKQGQKSFELAMSEIGLALPLLMAVLYTMGKERDEGSGSVKKRILTSLGEAGLTHAMIEHTKNIYPILGGCTAIYQAGTAQTNEDKLKALIKSAILFPLGAVAVLAGSGFTNGLRSCEAKRITTLLKDKTIQPLINKSALKSSNLLEQELSLLLTNLKNTTEHFANLFGSKQFNKRTLNLALKAMENAQTAFRDKIKINQKPIALLGENVQKVFSKIAVEINHAQSYRLLRFFNPWFAYILSVSIAGPILYKKACEYLFPVSSENTNNLNEPPLWLDRIIGLSDKKEFTGEHTHPWLKSDGPALLQSSWEGV